MIREHSAHIPHNLSDHRVVMLRHLRVIGLPHGESRRPAPPYENSTNLPNRNRGNPRNRTASPTPAKQLGCSARYVPHQTRVVYLASPFGRGRPQAG